MRSPFFLGVSAPTLTNWYMAKAMSASPTKKVRKATQESRRETLAGSPRRFGSKNSQMPSPRQNRPALAHLIPVPNRQIAITGLLPWPIAGDDFGTLSNLMRSRASARSSAFASARFTPQEEHWFWAEPERSGLRQALWTGLLQPLQNTPSRMLPIRAPQIKHLQPTNWAIRKTSPVSPSPQCRRKQAGNLIIA